MAPGPARPSGARHAARSGFGPCRPVGPLVLATVLALAPLGTDAAAQAIAFNTDLPRTLVFVPEEGGAGTATADLTAFLREAGFPLVDPALAHTAAQRELVQAALAGDEGAAVQLGRDFGAQVLLLGTADWGSAPDPVSQTLVTATSEVRLRALRLDGGQVVASARSSGRKLEATEQAARTGAIRQAVDELLETTPFVGAVVNNWDEHGWSGRGYFTPDPGSVEAVMDAPAGAGPKVAILRTDVAPPPDDGLTARGLGVVRKGDRSGVVNHVALEGVVVGRDARVEVEGQPAELEPLDAMEARDLGISEGPAMRFRATTALPLNRDSVRVVARAPDGATTTVVAAPRIDERWAVVIGISDYRADDIPDLDYAAADARAFRDFLRSDAAGPFEDDHVLYLENADATGQAMRQALFVFLQQADWNDLVVIYVAAHGAPDPERLDNLYLLPYDASLDALAATGFPMWDVKTALRRQIAAERVVVIADACHSAGTGEADANPIGGSFAELFTPSRRLTLTAADLNELSFEDARWGGGHGVFTYYLLEGLHGAADADHDGIVTFTEAAGYVEQHVRTDTNARQNPQSSGLGDVPLSVAGEAAGG